jgi:hypothetical protein
VIAQVIFGCTTRVSAELHWQQCGYWIIVLARSLITPTIVDIDKAVQMSHQRNDSLARPLS